jgi:hypothetical protein
MTRIRRRILLFVLMVVAAAALALPTTALAGWTWDSAVGGGWTWDGNTSGPDAPAPAPDAAG